MAEDTDHSPLQVSGEVFAVKAVGDFVHLTLVAPGVAERSRPGAFLTLGVGGEPSALLRRRPFWVHRARPAGVSGATVEVAFVVRGAGTRWLAGLRRHDRVDVIGPIGRPFALPREPVACAVVGDGYGAAPMFMLGERLRERDCSVHMVLGAAAEPGLFAALEARRSASSVTVATMDGSVGIKGGVMEALPKVLSRHHIDVVYACGPLGTVREVAALAGSTGAWCQVALEAPMSCGTGICSSCVVPVRDKDGVARPRRVCVDGPVFGGELVEWSLL